MTDAQLALNAAAKACGIAKQIATGGYYPTREAGSDQVNRFFMRLMDSGFRVLDTKYVPYTSVFGLDNVTVTLNCRFGAKGLNAITNIEIK